MTDYQADQARIQDIIETMFSAVSWSPTSPPDFDSFRAAVRSDAVLAPAARPVATTDIESFVARMNGLYRDGAMKHFDERAHKTLVHVFGNIAVAIGSFEASVDQGDITRGVNVFMFVRNEGEWQIAAMGWDNETEHAPLPAELV